MTTLKTKWDKLAQDTYAHLEATQNAIKTVVDRCFRELQLSVWQQYEVAKLAIDRTCRNLQENLRNKHFQLSPADLALCERTGPRCRLVLGDCRDAVAKTILAYSQVVDLGDDLVEVARKQAESGHIDMAEQVTDSRNGPSLLPRSTEKAETPHGKETAAALSQQCQ